MVSDLISIQKKNNKKKITSQSPQHIQKSSGQPYKEFNIAGESIFNNNNKKTICYRERGNFKIMHRMALEYAGRLVDSG